MTGLQRCSSAKGTPDTHGGGLLPSETVLLQLATVVRIALILYGEWQDTSVDVSYTDVDYLVYSDAAQSICDGGSPYARSTYRYTPLLAWLLVPNCVFPQYGKLLFSAYDIIAAMYVVNACKKNMTTSYTTRICSAGLCSALYHTRVWFNRQMRGTRYGYSV